MEFSSVLFRSPTAQLSGLGQDGPGLLRLFGSTQPFDDARLAALYPNGREQYLAQFRSSLQSAIAAGFILDDDREEIEALRSEEHTSELQSLMRNSYAVFCLKKKKNNKV